MIWAIDEYGDPPRITVRVTTDDPVSIGMACTAETGRTHGAKSELERVGGYPFGLTMIVLSAPIPLVSFEGEAGSNKVWRRKVSAE